MLKDRVDYKGFVARIVGQYVVVYLGRQAIAGLDSVVAGGLTRLINEGEVKRAVDAYLQDRNRQRDLN